MSSVISLLEAAVAQLDRARDDMISMLFSSYILYYSAHYSLCLSGTFPFKRVDAFSKLEHGPTCTVKMAMSMIKHAVICHKSRQRQWQSKTATINWNL